ncbi:MAG: aminodeoxychorismate lyase [Rheinheimera sp.]|nr:MAG: aminodeoxychorismate lyase [Rheinheimera sp.]
MQIQFSDRSFQYGDGIFSTIRICHGEPQLWSLHWQRLTDSMQRLGFNAPREDVVLSQVRAAISAPNLVLKVLISRGQGARGYGTLGINEAEIYCWTAPMPDYSTIRQQGVTLGLASMRLSQQPLLAGIKHCSRLETVLLKREAEQSQYDDLLVCDQQGFLIEASAANVLIWHQQQWWTPDLQQAGVAGVLRQLLLEQKLVSVQPLSASLLSEVPALALCNALMGVVPVAAFAGRQLDTGPAAVLQQQVDELLQEV